MTPIELNRLLSNMTSDANPSALLRSIDFKTLLPSTRHLLLDFAFSHDMPTPEVVGILQRIPLDNTSYPLEHAHTGGFIRDYVEMVRDGRCTDLNDYFSKVRAIDLRFYDYIPTKDEASLDTIIPAEKVHSPDIVRPLQHLLRHNDGRGLVRRYGTEFESRPDVMAILAFFDDIERTYAPPEQAVLGKIFFDWLIEEYFSFEGADVQSLGMNFEGKSNDACVDQIFKKYPQLFNPSIPKTTREIIHQFCSEPIDADEVGIILAWSTHVQLDYDDLMSMSGFLLAMSRKIDHLTYISAADWLKCFEQSIQVQTPFLLGACINKIPSEEYTQLQQPMVVLKVMDELNNLSLSQQWNNPLSALLVSWFGEERCLEATNLMNVFKSECPNEFRHYQETKPALEALDIDPDIRCCYLIQQYQQPVHVLPQVDFNMVAD